MVGQRVNRHSDQCWQLQTAPIRINTLVGLKELVAQPAFGDVGGFILAADKSTIRRCADDQLAQEEKSWLTFRLRRMPPRGCPLCAEEGVFERTASASQSRASELSDIKIPQIRHLLSFRSRMCSFEAARLSHGDVMRFCQHRGLLRSGSS
ncbi:hypothetical protein K458DRAFT_395739 [Lentithecium fluviatile CBS 122367]|uniref:Uncharacterized protein n=1 Tax=Lentithecium fluviatile CBS 122367 TaxID=1168545 RepID=A0A6G1IIE1_9PLEO|nr:hypothetical protein K458DRAFT_395739 [Lentithecium fluviatile CBS 122367]